MHTYISTAIVTLGSMHAYIILCFVFVNRYSSTKKFYCLSLKNGKQKCLGPGKGRHYPAMSAEAESLLYKYYQPHNQKLSSLLQELKVSLPNWLHSYD